MIQPDIYPFVERVKRNEFNTVWKGVGKLSLEKTLMMSKFEMIGLDAQDYYLVIYETFLKK